jgi:hypothetical protein
VLYCGRDFIVLLRETGRPPFGTSASSEVGNLHTAVILVILKIARLVGKLSARNMRVVFVAAALV